MLKILRIHFCSEAADGDDVYYYSTEYAFQQLLRTLDRNKYERSLVMVLEEMAAEIKKQMRVSMKLTDESKGNRKSILGQEQGKYGQLSSTLTHLVTPLLYCYFM